MSPLLERAVVAATRRKLYTPVTEAKSRHPSIRRLDLAEKFGVVGGVARGGPGGILSPVAALDPEPPPAPPAQQQPVRIGGAITQPALLERVNPVYPAVAEQARVGGLVVLEAPSSSP